MPKISPEKSDARRNEIIDSCEALYRSESYHDITMSRIAAGVSFGRANIYNYFQCKEEIVLALLQREHERWCESLLELADGAKTMSDSELADGLARSIGERGQMLKLLAMNLYDLEQNSRLENLIDFKRSYGQALAALRRVLACAKPQWDRVRIDRFLSVFLPFLKGVYPFAAHSEKQLEARRQAGIEPCNLDIRATTRDLTRKLLQED